MSGVQEARTAASRIARRIMTLGGSTTIGENIATDVFGEQFVELIDLVDPGLRSEVTITRDGKILGRVTIER